MAVVSGSAPRPPHFSPSVQGADAERMRFFDNVPGVAFRRVRFGIERRRPRRHLFFDEARNGLDNGTMALGLNEQTLHGALTAAPREPLFRFKADTRFRRRRS